MAQRMFCHKTKTANLLNKQNSLENYLFLLPQKLAKLMSTPGNSLLIRHANHYIIERVYRGHAHTIEDIPINRLSLKILENALDGAH